MKYRCPAWLLFLALTTSWSQAIARSTAPFTCAGSVILLLDSAEAAAATLRPDAYTREHTVFDRAIRLNNANASEADYLLTAARNVRTWPPGEVASLQASFAEIESSAKTGGLTLHLPDTIKMIKTTAGEEFGAEGFTREARIMLNTAAQPISTHLLAHELWHVISRMNEAVRNNAYAAFHFKPCNNIEYKPALNNQVITNPDCPYLMHYMTVEKDGRKQDVTLLLYSQNAYKPGLTMDYYVSIGLLALSGDDSHKKPLLKNGKPVIYELMDVPDFLRQIGKNTEYLLHIEEVAAEHFAALITGKQLQQMELVDGMKQALIK